MTELYGIEITPQWCNPPNGRSPVFRTHPDLSALHRRGFQKSRKTMRPALSTAGPWETDPLVTGTQACVGQADHTVLLWAIMRPDHLS